MNSYKLTKRVDKVAFANELRAAKIGQFNIDDSYVHLVGDLTPQAITSRLAKIAQAESNHVPIAFTEVAVNVQPHFPSLKRDLEAVGISGIGFELPESYPGTLVVIHGRIDPALKSSIEATVAAHDPNSFPRLMADVASDVVVAPDGTATRNVVITDSRGSSAAGNTIRLRLKTNVSIPVNGDTFTLDGSGKATVVFGPSSSVTGNIGVELYYDDDQAEPVLLTVRFGSV